MILAPWVGRDHCYWFSHWLYICNRWYVIRCVLCWRRNSGSSILGLVNLEYIRNYHAWILMYCELYRWLLVFSPPYHHDNSSCATAIYMSLTNHCCHCCPLTFFCHLQGFNRPACYIAAQGPMSNTESDIWRMIWEQDLSNIVMLTNCIEAGKVNLVGGYGKGVWWEKNGVSGGD